MANSSARSRRGLMESSRLPAGRGRDSASLLGFHFRDPSLFECALVHRSYCNERGLDASDSYERLEFLGDAVLELTVSEHLFSLFPAADEGVLTKSRSSLVRGEVLARVARRLGLGDMLLVGRGVEATDGRNQDSVLAACFEALLGAIYLDLGQEAARRFIFEQLKPELNDIIQRGSPPENPKSRLQELLQGMGRPTPSYRVSGREGPDHCPVFTVEAVVEEAVIGEGRGGRKSDAERAAAEDALEAFRNGSLPSQSPGVQEPQPSGKYLYGQNVESSGDQIASAKSETSNSSSSTDAVHSPKGNSSSSSGIFHRLKLIGKNQSSDR